MVPTEWVNEDSCSFLYMGGAVTPSTVLRCPPAMFFTDY